MVAAGWSWAMSRFSGKRFVISNTCHGFWGLVSLRVFSLAWGRICPLTLFFMCFSLLVKNFFRVSFKNGSQSQTHSLQANDTFNKQQWLNCIRQAKETVLCAAGQAGVLDSEGSFLNPTTGSRELQGETKLEQMDQSDSESDCSMDTSEVSFDCERMEQTDSSCGNSRHGESNVWQKHVHFGKQACVLPVQYLHSADGTVWRSTFSYFCENIHVDPVSCICTFVPSTVTANLSV